MRSVSIPFTLSLLVPALACDTANVSPDDTATDTFREGWTNADDPSLLSPDFEFKFSALPTEGSATKIPWAGSYWPTYKDAINDRWEGPNTMSPAKKYEVAFGLSGVEDAVSAENGVDSVSAYSEECTSDDQCDPDKGSVCAKRTGESTGACTETWFGICHAWAPAAILEEEPTKGVTYNGVEFKINDLKALMSFVYGKGLHVKFLSLRCNDKGDDPGVADKPACKDTNPGSFHVAIANLVGLQGRSLVEDRTYDYEVWNQPIRSFKVTLNETITAKEANERLGGGALLSKDEFDANVAANAWKQLTSVPVSEGQGLRVQMKGSGDGDLYVRWNDQPSASSYHCRPYEGGSQELCELTVPAGATSAKIAVHGYTNADVDVTVELREATGDAYAYNPEAASLRLLRTELRWIGESPSTLDGNLGGIIDNYTSKDIYDYILELDGSGEIIGGEWLGSSRENHPDFLWLPIQKYNATIGKVAYNDVRELFELAAGEPLAPEGGLDVSDTVSSDEWKHYSIEVDADAEATLTVQSGDADLYVRKGSKPTAASYDCRPYHSGTKTEECSLSGAGTYHISVHGYSSSSDYSLKVVE